MHSLKGTVKLTAQQVKKRKERLRTTVVLLLVGSETTPYVN